MPRHYCVLWYSDITGLPESFQFSFDPANRTRSRAGHPEPLFSPLSLVLTILDYYFVLSLVGE